MSHKKTNRARTTQAFLLRLSVACFVGLFFLLLLQTADAGKTGAVSANVVAPDADAVITVTTTADDITPNDGSVSLREAITASNAGNDLGDPDITAQNPGTFGPLNTINFNIAGSGAKTINVGSNASASGIPLPSITKPVIINGYTQGAAHANTQVNMDDAVILIELNGAGAGGGNNGLVLSSGSGGSTIKGLAINRFSFNGVLITTNGNTISGNFIGTNAAGSSALGNTQGVLFNGGAINTTIGGPGVADRNIISGNLSHGIFINVGSGNTVQGNFIGISANGASALGNNAYGVVVEGSANNTIQGNIISGNVDTGISVNLDGATGNTIQGNKIGTNAAGTAALPNGTLAPNLNGGVEVTSGHNNSILGNIISGNVGTGVNIDIGGVSGNVVAGNFIGTDVTGIAALPNTTGGVAIFRPSGGSSPVNNIIGNSTNGGNIIAFNGGPGVSVGLNASDPATGNAIRLNSIFSNAGLGIDLGNNGVTNNDAGDADTGPNNLQNFPLLTSAASGGGGTTIKGSLNSTANTNFLIDFYSTVASCGQGQTYVGTISATTDAGGNATFTANFPSVSLPVGRHITATATTSATAPAGDTSEFSPCVDVVAGGPTSTLTATGASGNAVEGLPFTNGVVATFTSSNAALPASNFNATINWGDQTAFSSGAIISNGGGSFTVEGSHSYSEEGSYAVTVTIHDTANNIDATANGSAFVADAPLSIAQLSAGTNQQFMGVGGNNTSVTGGTANAALNAFKTAIGGVDNGGTASPQNGGFRTITWDGVALDGTDFGGATTTIVPNFVVGIPVNRFQERGMQFEEVYAVSGPASGADASTFTTVNSGVSNLFKAFSPTKTFAMFNDNTIDFNFVLPSAHTGPPIQAITRGFGAIFLNVQIPNSTSIEYFSGTTSLGKFFVPTGMSGQAEFFGVLFQNPAVTRVHIVLGTATLFSFDGVNVTSGPPDNPGGGTNLAVTDDFAYAEPTAVSTGINISATVGSPFTAKVASFTDADPNGQVSDYSVVINWGDGTTSAGGVTPNLASRDGNPADSTEAVTITPSINGGFDVTGTHTYQSLGTFTITTSIRDVGGASISAASTATVGGVPVLGSFQFSSSTASVLENAVPDSVALTVTRTGDTSGPATVKFETADITAQQKSKYTFGSGTVQFGPGDTSKTVNILIVNEAFVEGSKTFEVTLSNPSSGWTLASPSNTVVTIFDDDFVPPTTNPIDDAGFFVRQHYLDFLGREADPSGLSFWTNQITACGSNASCIAAMRVNVSAAFFLSIEYQETSGNVVRTQRVAFGRQSADAFTRVPYLQFMRDTHQVGQGVVVGQPGFDTLLEQNKQAYAEQVVADPNFTARFPIQPGPQYVDDLYASAGVTPTAADRTAAINAFGGGGTPGRVAALRSVADSNSVRQAEFNAAFVLAEYYGYLRRNPTDAPDFNDSGYQFWLAKLNSFNGDFNKSDMVKAFIVSGEYRQRFGP